MMSLWFIDPPSAQSLVEPTWSLLAPSMEGETAALGVGHGFVLEMLTAPSTQLAPTDAVLLLSVMQANVARVSASAELQTRYQLISEPPPMELYQPVSILSIADALRLPFETARRRIHRLARAGLCEVSRSGCLITAGVVTGSGYAASAMQVWGMLERFCAALSALRVSPSFEVVGPARARQAPPARLVSRIFGDYVLRTVASAFPQDGDLVDRLIVMAVNSEAARLGATHRRVSNVRVARATRTHSETARRRLEALRSRGILVKFGAAGWGVAEGANSDISTAARSHLVSARRCLANLQRYGVLKEKPV
jgi:hypothetical protein